MKNSSHLADAQLAAQQKFLGKPTKRSLNDSRSQIINHLQFIFDYLSKLLTYTTAEPRQRTQIELIYFIISLPRSLAFPSAHPQPPPPSPLFSNLSSKRWFNDLISGRALFMLNILWASLRSSQTSKPASVYTIFLHSSSSYEFCCEELYKYLKTINSLSAPLSIAELAS